MENHSPVTFCTAIFHTSPARRGNHISWYFLRLWKCAWKHFSITCRANQILYHECSKAVYYCLVECLSNIMPAIIIQKHNRWFGARRPLKQVAYIYTETMLLLLSWCLMSSDVIWHIRDKLWPMPKHGSIRKVYACLVVTCHLHFWQNDRDFLRATVVTRGWNGYRNKSQHRKSTLEKKILPPFQQGFEPATFQSRVRRSNHWAIPAPIQRRALLLFLIMNFVTVLWSKGKDSC